MALREGVGADLRRPRGDPGAARAVLRQAFRAPTAAIGAGKEALGRGMKSVGIRLARTVNRVFGRKGPALLGRYHLRVLRTPREVRHALAYVLLNVRKHWRQRNGIAPPVVLDIASSGAWFDGWKRSPPMGEPKGSPAVASPRYWLLREGWRIRTRERIAAFREKDG